jgi:GT2 family glycosyltransferase
VATAVISIDIERVPPRLSTDPRYSQAFIVLRRSGFPVARFEVPVAQGAVDMTAFAHALFEVIHRSGRWWRLQDFLGPAPCDSPPRGSVAICTRERPHDLAQALEAVEALDPSPDEILVVDNAPASDATRQVVGTFSRVRYVCEPHPGLDHARNRALREATGEIVAFTDDDAVPEKRWFGELVQPFLDSRVWCATGLTLPLELETPAQEWFERLSSFNRGFKRRVFDGTRHDPLNVGSIGAGANMAVRRSVLTALGGFDEALDAGTPTKSGGDHELFGRILAAGYRIVYEPRAVSWHRHRRTWPELQATLRGYGTGVYAMWTRRLLRDHEVGVFRHAVGWLYHDQLRRLWRSVRFRGKTVPLDLIRAEFIGCMTGAFAYGRSVRQLRKSRV